MISQQNAKKKNSWSPSPNKSNIDEWICFKKSIKTRKKTTSKLGKPTKLDPDHANEIIQ